MFQWNSFCLFVPIKGFEMETGVSYQNYISAREKLQPFEDRTAHQSPYSKDFEEIYNEAFKQEIKLSSAKEFLEGLSKNEMRTLQKYSGLADAVDIGTISKEGAYNLLVHDYEQYDFNNDGVAEVGLAKTILPVPTTMPADVRDAYITAMNSVDDKERLMLHSLTFDIERIKSLMNNTPYTPSVIDYDYLSKNVDRVLNPRDGEYSSDEFKLSVSNFWEVFESAYNGSRETNSKESIERDPQIEKFLKDLREKGAMKFLSNLNQEKIEAKIDEYKSELLAELGNSPEALANIDKLVNDLKKQLLEELKYSLNSDEKNPTISKQAVILNILNLKDVKASNLESLLQENSN